MTIPVDRRTFLRVSGVALALLLLESMQPALARAATASPKPSASPAIGTSGTSIKSEGSRYQHGGI